MTIERPVSAPTNLSNLSNLWREENSRGLSFAAAGNWPDASQAFSSAVDALSARSDVAAHDALALILNNLAQSCFHDGRTEDAIRFAQRACSLRVALVGEDAIAVARARSELAVMLGSVNRASEGLSLIARAISAIERSAGDDDIRLLTVLENAARLALAAGQPSTAEPYLLRLHALLDANGMATDVVESLLSRVVAFRLEQQLMAMESFADASHDEDTFAPDVVQEDEEPSVELPMLVIDAFGDADDEPLRDAVAITDVLLRTTPTGNRAIVVAELDVEERDIEERDVEERDVEERDVEEPAPSPILDTVDKLPDSGDIFGGAMFELVELQDAQPASTTPIELDVVAENPTMASASMLVELDLLGDDQSDSPLELLPVHHEPQTPVELTDGGLGFTVEYGAISTEMSYEDMQEPTQEPAQEPAVVAHPKPVADELVAAPATKESVPAPRTTPVGALLVVPTPTASQSAIGRAKTGAHLAGGSDGPPRLTLQNTDDVAESRQVKKPVFRAGHTNAPRNSQGMLIAGGAAAAIIAAASWFLMMGR